ncbi:hypothetical protein [Cellulomonas sp. NPDC089187]|uniref:hypothetical protein n=1 Tax=Cellulomonas sp. NPDC089187 TaxID=3154970 RepID=UPI00342A57A2
MTASTSLLAAIEVFRELGWDTATPADAPHLPLGTPDQQAVAKRGLKSGDWVETGQTGKNSWGVVWSVDVDRPMLGLFAVRVGVDARRAAAVMPSAHAVDDELATEVLAQRGPVFAEQFIAQACVPTRRIWTHDTTAFAGSAVRLVIRHGLSVPENLDYLKDWATYAAGALTDGAAGELVPKDRGWIPAEDLAPRYAEHARAAVAAGVPATGPFAATLGPAAERGWIDRAEALDLAFTGLDTAQRPGDRKAWAQLIAGALAATGEEIAARATALLPVLAQGDAPVIEALAPALIQFGTDEQVVELLGTTLLISSTKARRLLLTTAARRPAPAITPDDPLVETLAELTTDPRPALAQAATTLAAAWSVPVTAPEPEPTLVRGLWQSTPPLWTVPRFDAGEATPERVTDTLGRVGGPHGTADPVDFEQLLTLTVQLAHRDPEAARQALSGIGHRIDPWLHGLSSWVNRRTAEFLEIEGRKIVSDPEPARNIGVADRLGAIPVLLSAPSWVDLRIDPADLVDRLRQYQRLRRVPVVEADLLLAMLRTDGDLLTPDLRAALADLTVPIQRQDGSRMELTAGPAVLAYLDDPLIEPQLTASVGRPWWHVESETVPASLAAFPDRFRARLDSLTVPCRIDPDRGVGAGHVPLWHQVRRRAPFGPGSTLQVLTAVRDADPDRAAETADAAQLAWERGLLRPGVADIRYLDWRTSPPSNLASFAATCRDLAEVGLLPVVWPVLDDLIADGLTRTRMPAGTVELVTVLHDFLPEVTDPAALALPGVRALAGKGGSSRAVALARTVVAQLPEATVVVPEAPTTVAPDQIALWPESAGSAPAVVDDLRLVAGWDDPEERSKRVVVDLTSPEGERFRVSKGWYYDLESEGQCQAYPWTADTPPMMGRGKTVWLRWIDGRLEVGEHRHPAKGTDAPHTAGRMGPLTTSMVAVVLCGLCHDGTDTAYAIHRMFTNGQIGWASVRAVLPVLLDQPAIIPARLTRPLTDDAAALPTLWPVLTESIRHAATLDGTAPRWLNTVLDVALHHAPLLRWAAAEGRIPAEDATWPGLAEIAGRGGSTAAVRKARDLREELGLDERHQVTPAGAGR